MAEGFEGLKKSIDENDDPSMQATGSQVPAVVGSRMISELPEEKNDDRPMEREVETSEQTPMFALQPRKVPEAETVNNPLPNEGAALERGNQDVSNENNPSESGVEHQKIEQIADQDRETDSLPRQNDIEDPSTSIMPPVPETRPSSSMQNQPHTLSKVRPGPSKYKQRFSESELQTRGAVGGYTDQPAQRPSSVLSAGAQPPATTDASLQSTSNNRKGDSVTTRPHQAHTKRSRKRGKKKKTNKSKRRTDARPQQRRQEIPCPSNNPPPAATAPQHEPPTERQITAVQCEPEEVAAQPSRDNTTSSHRVETNSYSSGGSTNLAVPLEMQRILVHQNPARNNHQVNLEVRPRPVIERSPERRETPTRYLQGPRELGCNPIVTISVKLPMFKIFGVVCPVIFPRVLSRSWNDDHKVISEARSSQTPDEPKRVCINLLNDRPMASWVWFSQQQPRADLNGLGQEAEAVEIDLRPDTPQEVYLRSDNEMSCRAF